MRNFLTRGFICVHNTCHKRKNHASQWNKRTTFLATNPSRKDLGVLRVSFAMPVRKGTVALWSFCSFWHVPYKECLVCWSGEHTITAVTQHLETKCMTKMKRKTVIQLWDIIRVCQPLQFCPPNPTKWTVLLLRLMENTVFFQQWEDLILLVWRPPNSNTRGDFPEDSPHMQMSSCAVYCSHLSISKTQICSQSCLGKLFPIRCCMECRFPQLVLSPFVFLVIVFCCTLKTRSRAIQAIDLLGLTFCGNYAE